MSRRKPSGKGWARTEAEEALRNVKRAKGRTNPTLRSWWRQLAAPTGAKARNAILLTHAVLVLLAIFLHSVNVNVAASFHPHQPDEALQTLWQVEAAIVAIAFPFLLLLFEFTKERQAPVAKPITEVLIRYTFVIPGIIFGSIALITIGASTIWIATEEVIVLQFLVLSISIVSLLWSYLRAVALLFDTQKLRRLAIAILREKLEGSMDELWVTRRANAIINRAVSSEDVSIGPWLVDHNQYAIIRATQSGRIVDINYERLLALIDDSVTVPIANPQSTTSQQGPVGSVSPLPRAYIPRLCGDEVGLGSPVLYLRLPLSPSTSIPEISIAYISTAELR